MDTVIGLAIGVALVLTETMATTTRGRDVDRSSQPKAAAMGAMLLFTLAAAVVSWLLFR